jgi:hypothetical protein
VLWVADTGLAPAANRAYPERSGGHVLFAEKLRVGAGADNHQALTRQGRYRQVTEQLQVKEVRIGQGRPSGGSCLPQPRRGHPRRRPPGTPPNLDHRGAGRHRRQDRRWPAAEGMLLANPALRRHHGRLAIVKTKVNAEAKLDGKFLLSTTDPTIPAADLARLYKGLLESRPPGATSSRSSSCTRSTTGSRTASAPTSACASWRWCWCGSPSTPAGRPGRACAPSWTACTLTPSTARPGVWSGAPSPPRPAGHLPGAQAVRAARHHRRRQLTRPPTPLSLQNRPGLHAHTRICVTQANSPYPTLIELATVELGSGAIAETCWCAAARSFRISAPGTGRCSQAAEGGWRSRSTLLSRRLLTTNEANERRPHSSSSRYGGRGFAQQPRSDSALRTHTNHHSTALLLWCNALLDEGCW